MGIYNGSDNLKTLLKGTVTASRPSEPLTWEKLKEVWETVPKLEPQPFVVSPAQYDFLKNVDLGGRQILHWGRQHGRTSFFRDWYDKLNNDMLEGYYKKAYWGMDMASGVEDRSIGTVQSVDKDGNVRVIIGNIGDGRQGIKIMDCEAAQPAYDRKTRMHPKDEKLVELAIEVGQGRERSEILYQAQCRADKLERKLKEAEDFILRQDKEIKTLTNSRASWAASYTNLERRYENLRKKHAPKKAVKKAATKKSK